MTARAEQLTSAMAKLSGLHTFSVGAGIPGVMGDVFRRNSCSNLLSCKGGKSQ